MAPANVFDDELEFDQTDPEGFRAGMLRVGKAAGGEELAVKAFSLPPGQSLCPYHYEYVEEWLLVLDGDVVLRTPAGEQQLVRGDLACFAPGPAGAHKVSNRGELPARVLMFSSAHEPAVAVYPDSDKIGLWTGDPDLHVLVRKGSRLDYYDGEV
jgi:uncharacterized cupin superfamily protein